MAELKPYNLQSISINRFLQNCNESEFIKDLQLNSLEFLKKYNSMVVRDIHLKNHSLEIRNMKIINPESYFYYTHLVFNLVLSPSKSKKTFFTKHKKAFYSGFLQKNINQFKKENTIYNKSYFQYLKILENYENHEMLYIDLSNFFDSITTDALINELQKRYPSNYVDNLKKYFDIMNIKSLPQLHSSIASSILSQEYLHSFDIEINMILKQEGLKLIRFVDDMYFINIENRKPKGEKFYYTLLDRISYIAWKYNLSINGNKIEVYTKERPFTLKLIKNSYHFQSEEKIDNKAKQITGENILEFIKNVEELYRTRGFDFKMFKEYFNETFSIDGEDGQKVLNNFIYTKKWKAINHILLQEMIEYHRFIYFLPNPFLILYLKVYDYIEDTYGRNNEHIRRLVAELDNNIDSSLMIMNTSINYLIQRGFKRTNMLNSVDNYYSELGIFLKRYILSVENE